MSEPVSVPDFDTAHERAAPMRIGYLDALRGMASLIIAVMWHYQHFSSEHQPGSAPLTEAPYFHFLPMKLGFKYGFVTVDLFFMLSGIVFSHVYWQKIAERRVSAKNFFVLRFSRLYPLQLATLLIVTALAYSFRHFYGRFPIYSINDAYHFVLNLLFLQKGFIDKGYSFDGPSWSLSIEAMLYCLFFGVASLRSKLWLPILFYTTGLFILGSGLHERFFLNEEIARGLGGFFLGTFLYRAATERKPVYILAPIALFALTALAFWWPNQSHGPLAYLTTVWFYPICWTAFAMLLALIHRFAILQRLLQIKLMVILGEISLGIYLLHVPLQMAILFALKATGQAIPYSSLLFWLGYMALLLILSIAVFYGFERPMQRLLRRRLLTEKA